MKKIIEIGIVVFALLALLAAIEVLAQPKPIKPIGPFEAKPVLIKSQYVFEQTGMYYHKAKMPDGSVREIKSRVPLTAIQWEERARKAYIKPMPVPEPCSRCNGTGIELLGHQR